MFQIIQASTPADYQTGAALFKEYAASLDFTLCFQNFDDELTVVSDMYGAPTGVLLLVKNENEYIGAVGLRRIENDFTCEVKRMYIRLEFQGKGIGKALMSSVIECARMLHYKIIKLDTLGTKMPAAVALYKSFGFRETVPYNYNPYDGVLYFERELS
ncbi:GNAT family N-acetyltransferase [Dyadobacter sediminis]|uniref:GNAT family N-acetyltransferase n=1 Tax=Dyadobacter sediminis TaxID=1493691 RepID=A0A5R9KA69_9BACT|nr:GNAT family N-acetyltransferase [Dyadobacter sediminis]TLU91710.1 GNAT family N-acetyltransferase [Dyadobacter sediminis]GGC00973.1 N-acetyltransferase [Dyadobacter sediminis]